MHTGHFIQVPDICCTNTVGLEDNATENYMALCDLHDTIAPEKPDIKAMKDLEREDHYIVCTKEQKERVSRIRHAMAAAETIQHVWRKYKLKRLACSN